MTVAGSICLNQGRRAVRCGGFLGARLRSGSDRPGEQRGVGDCLLLDFGKGFFAVSDSSDRDPSFSRAFLLRFTDILAGLPGVGPGKIFSASEQTALQEELESRSSKVLGEMCSTESCTFTGILILKTESGWRGLVLHSGDSLLLKCDLDARAVRQVTQNNFWMVGRTSRFFQVEFFPLTEQTRLLLATDGFSCLKQPEEGTQEDFVCRLFAEHPAEEIPDYLIDGFDAADAFKDDLALLSIHPLRIGFQDRRVLLGGTTSRLERHFRDGIAAGRYRDVYERMPRAGVPVM